MTPLYDSDVQLYIRTFDFVCLTETFSITFPSFLYPDYEPFISPGIRLTDATTARLSGGVVVMVRKAYLHLVRHITVEYDNTVVLHVKYSDLELALIGMYLPPANSVYYAETEISNGVSLLEQCLIDIFQEIGDCPLLIFGDLNARTGGLNAKELSDFDGDVNVDDDTHSNDMFCRVSKDNCINEFGRYLLNVCEHFGLVILNGHLPGDEQGEYTYIAHNGSSTIDYFIISRSIISVCSELKISSKIESKHMPVELKLLLSHANSKPAIQKKIKYEKYIWDSNKKSDFTSTLDSIDATLIFNEAHALIDVNTEHALHRFNDGLYMAGQCMNNVIVVGNLKRSPWFDSECFTKRREVRHALRVFRQVKSNNIAHADAMRQTYSLTRKQYKDLLRKKYQVYRQHILSVLNENAKNSKLFWNTVRSIKSNYHARNTISAADWYLHFKGVFNDELVKPAPNVLAIHDSGKCLPYFDSEIDVLDHPITEAEVMNAIKALKSNKAPGPDRLIGEFYKQSSPTCAYFLTKYFNKIFDYGSFPSTWCESLIQPLHKKGDINSPDNYRGISLINIGSKLYSYIINKRLTQWIEDNCIINEAQAGFRKKYSTTDHIFTLFSLVQKQFSNNKKLYVAFIDFKKAFDMVDRNKLWSILRKRGIKGKMYNAIKSMYSVVKARVKVNGTLTDTFMCPRGLKQGDICSPVLFSLFINELAEEVIQRGKHGIPLSPDLIQIMILLFADDIALMSSTVIGLQQQLNILCDTAKKLDLIVNLQKSNIIVFRKGGYISAKEKWFYDGMQLDIVNQYKYLGVLFSTGLTFSHCLEDLAVRGKRQVICILRLLWKFQNLSPKLFFKLFDTQIQPILTYSAEVWGLTGNHSIIEKIHLFALKRFLNVSVKTPNALVYGETGRHPLFINIYTKCMKYWINIVNMSDNRLPKKAYKMLYHLHCRGKINWASSVCNTLYKYGFGYIWENQSVCNSKRFLVEFKNRLIDCHLQDWDSLMSSKDRFLFYYSFKQFRGVPSYLFTINNLGYRKSLIRFRLGVSFLNTHRLRYSGAPREALCCPFCPNEIESEFHFLMKCPKYNTLRELFIPTKFYTRASVFKVSLLLANERISKDVASYISKALDIRSKRPNTI